MANVAYGKPQRRVIDMFAPPVTIMEVIDIIYVDIVPLGGEMDSSP